MTDAAQLREAMEKIIIHAGGPAKDSHKDYWFLDDHHATHFRDLYEAAQTLLTLLEAHGDGIQGLIDGTHEIKERVMSCGCNTDWSNSERPIITICEKHMTELADNYRNAKEG